MLEAFQGLEGARQKEATENEIVLAAAVKGGEDRMTPELQRASGGRQENRPQRLHAGRQRRQAGKWPRSRVQRPRFRPQRRRGLPHRDVG